jgi:hypothetical protein
MKEFQHIRLTNAPDESTDESTNPPGNKYAIFPYQRGQLYLRYHSIKNVAFYRISLVIKAKGIRAERRVLRGFLEIRVMTLMIQIQYRSTYNILVLHK